jgi:hypothetical protein
MYTETTEQYTLVYTFKRGERLVDNRGVTWVYDGIQTYSEVPYHKFKLKSKEEEIIDNFTLKVGGYYHFKEDIQRGVIYFYGLEYKIFMYVITLKNKLNQL